MLTLTLTPTLTLTLSSLTPSSLTLSSLTLTLIDAQAHLAWFGAEVAWGELSSRDDDGRAVVLDVEAEDGWSRPPIPNPESLTRTVSL